MIPLPPAKPSEDLSTLSAPVVDDMVGAATRLTPRPVLDLVSAGPDSVVAALSAAGTRPRPTVASGRIGGPLGRSQAIGQAGQSIKGLVADARGDVAVLLEGCAGGGGGCSLHHVWIVVRRAGGVFGKPIALVGQANAMRPALAIGPTGDVLVAWAAGTPTDSRLLARTRFASGRVGPVHTLGPAYTEGMIAAATGPSDRAIVGWVAAAAGGPGGAAGPATFRVALAGAGGQFDASHTLDRWDVPGTFTPASIDVAITGTGTGLVAWQGYNGTNFDIDVVRTNGLQVSPPAVSPPGGDATLDSLATGPSGAGVVLWTDPAGIEAGTATPGGPIAGPELVAAGEGAYGALAAFDPLSGSVVAVWYTANELSVDYSVRSPL